MNIETETFEAASASPVRGAQLVGLAAQVLRSLASAPDEGARIADVVVLTGLARPTVTRIVRALCAEGLAMRREGEPRYVLGPLTFELGLAAGRHFRLLEAASASMEKLAALSGDTCFMMIRSGQDAVCIDRREGVYPVRALTIEVGDRRPLGAAAASLALLMHLPPAEADRYIEANAQRIEGYGMLNATVVRAMLARARDLGYALNHNNIIAEVSAVGVAIPARYGPPYAALSVSALTSRMMKPDRVEQVARWLTTESLEIAARLQGA